MTESAPEVRKVDLYDGDFSLIERGSKTLLVLNAPLAAKRKAVSVSARLLSRYNPAAWGTMKRRAKAFSSCCPGILDELERLERERKPVGAVKLGAGKYTLSISGVHTVLGSEEAYIAGNGNYPNWSMDAWKKFLRRAAVAFEDERLDDELARLMEKSRLALLRQELPVIDDDRTPPHLLGLHTLELRHSRQRNYLTLAGETFRLRDELKKVMNWDPARKLWHGPFDRHILRQATNLVKKYDRIDDPVKAGLVQCWVCGSWVPREDATEKPGGEWYCGCLQRMKGMETENVDETGGGDQHRKTPGPGGIG